ncbi:MAG: decaprenyl-phosphate phosphoribosyltransferase [Acidimicrobiia bacterium]
MPISPLDSDDLGEAPAPAAAAPAPDRPPVVELPGWRSTFAGGLLRTARPKQWVKNVLVFAAPGAAGVLTEGPVLARALGAFAAWCAAASGTYFLNDALDMAADRAHPRKRLRPVAAGVVSPAVAKAVAGLLLAVAVVVPLGWGAGGLSVVLATYVAIQISYSCWLKEMPVIDLAAVASGFVLRAISGGVAADVPLSNWFLIVASFGSLFMVAGKRHAEHLDLADDRGTHRRSLDAYSIDFLRQVRSVAASVTITAYCLWAFERMDASPETPIGYQLSIVPFVLALLRYALVVDAGRGGAPEEVVFSDRVLQVLGAVWVVAFAAGVYAS